MARGRDAYSGQNEVGINELEIMEFMLGSITCGINVAKVREIIRFTQIYPLPYSTPQLPGIIKVRNEVIPVVDLAEHLNFQVDPNRDIERDLFIVTYFSKSTVAFRVNAVNYITSFSWEDIESYSQNGAIDSTGGSINSVARIGDRVILVLDYEKILADLYPNTGITKETIDAIDQTRLTPSSAQASEAAVLVAEDSDLLRNFLSQALQRAGNKNTIICMDGLEAWEKLQKFKSKGGHIRDHVSLVITDIEMPRLNGHALLGKIKEDSYLKDVPVIMFSSLITPQMEEKCTMLGASEVISKPELEKLIETMSKYLK